jgi:hypothetical protein
MDRYVEGFQVDVRDDAIIEGDILEGERGRYKAIFHLC